MPDWKRVQWWYCKLLYPYTLNTYFTWSHYGVTHNKALYRSTVAYYVLTQSPHSTLASTAGSCQWHKPPTSPPSQQPFSRWIWVVSLGFLPPFHTAENLWQQPVLVLYRPDVTDRPGALTTPSPTRAVILSESLPPSTAIPSCCITWHMALQASYRPAADEPPSLAAGHIQLALHLTSYVDTHTHTVSHSMTTPYKPHTDVIWLVRLYRIIFT